jgi:hypothetical protein
MSVSDGKLRDPAPSATELAGRPPFQLASSSIPDGGPGASPIRFVSRPRFRAERSVVACHDARNSLSYLAILEPANRPLTTNDPAPEATADGRAGGSSSRTVIRNLEVAHARVDLGTGGHTPPTARSRRCYGFNSLATGP